MRLSMLFSTTVGRKHLVAVSGLLFSLFVLSHMLGNLLLFVGPDAYNLYSYKLTSNPLLIVAELGLVLLFVTHFTFALKLAWTNRVARPHAPRQPSAKTGKKASFASRSMAYSGVLLLAFTVLHLWTFKYGTHYTTVVDGVEMRDLYKLVAEKFQSPLYVGWYALCLVLLGLHLSHGIGATFQSFGFASVRSKKLMCASKAIAWIVMAGFLAQPIYFFLRGGNL